MTETQAIREVIKAKRVFTVAEIQKFLCLDYIAVKRVVDCLIKENAVRFCGGTKYLYTAKSTNKDRRFISDFGYDEDKEISEIIKCIDEAEKRVKSGGDSSCYDKVSQMIKQFQDFCNIRVAVRSVDVKDGIQRLTAVLDKISLKKQEKISANCVPSHSLWENEEEFGSMVMERLGRLVRTDLKMGRQGAITKAELYLDAMRDSHDRKMVQVYERLVYELKASSDYLYNQLRGQARKK